MADDDIEDDDEQGYLTGQLLVAMPGMRDPRFTRTVIYMCVHNSGGAMGLVLNRLIGSLSFRDLLSQLEIGQDAPEDAELPSVHFGGPVETSRGFVLHSTDYLRDDTLQLNERMALTATVDILRDIARGSGPTRRILALGYAGWGPHQLDTEIQENAWLSVEADDTLVFGSKLDVMWDKAMEKLGIDAALLSNDAGHA